MDISAMTLKEAKKAYKKARLLEEEGDLCPVEQSLRSQLGDAGWADFAKNVDVFLEEAKKLGAEVDTAARDLRNILVESALEPYLERAKALGCGAQKFVRQIYDKAIAERETVRAEHRAGQAQEPAKVFYPSLPPDWMPKFFFPGEKVPKDRRFGVAMNEFCFVSLWRDGCQKAERLRQLIEDAKKLAGNREDFDNAMALAETWLGYAIPAAREAESREVDTDEQANVIKQLGDPLIGYVRRFRKRRETNIASRIARSEHVVSIKGVEIQPVPVPSGLPAEARAVGEGTMRALSAHPNDITTLAPGSAWTVFLDESYTGDDGDFETGGVGIMAGVICRDDNPLPPLPDLHCSQDSTPERLESQDRALEEILHHPNCGVMAIPSSAYDVSMGWDDALASWIDVVVRLLPLPDDDSVVSMRICVEPHDPYRTSADFRALKLVCEKSLKESFPERARRLRLSFEPLPKPAPGERSGNAYPDIIGFTCLRRLKDNTARQRYAASGWRGVCHLDMRSESISRLLRAFYRSEPLDAAVWSAMVSCGSFGIMGTLAARFGERAMSSVDEWTRYLGFLCEHLHSGSIDMAKLRSQIEWLERFRPAAIPDRTRLAWLTARIALENHEGRISAASGTAMRAEFDNLCTALYDEDAPLVCEATLNLAVAYTNCYEFEMALALIQTLLGKERATVGLLGYGKLLSSAGQHFAFLGMSDDAIGMFKDALDSFSKLTDEGLRVINTDITRAYLATATMDGRPKDARSALALYLLGDAGASDEALAREAVRLARERSAKFHHHVFLRYIASQPQDNPLRKAYIGQKANWCAPSVGHPWEMIEFYRAQLLPPGQERERRLETAYRLATSDSGETLMAIAAVIAGAALADGLEGEWVTRLSQLAEELRNLPGLADQGRYQAILDQPAAKLPPLAFAAKVLPFNFR